MNLTDVPARYYFDTSIFGGYYDDEFLFETNLIFEKVLSGKIICLYSEIIEEELKKAPSRVTKLFNTLNDNQKEKIHISEEILMLAHEYITEKVVGETSLYDCIHIAAATVHQADALISWNFKHIVNSNRIIGYNHINSQRGLTQITIKSPREIL
ncbi:hypothetical protein [Aquirufa regiilacus]|uniref:PIN domain-containing protein n=1 Tax=Aquirufa regiilacus TaxID=3024868 RepID=A0ABU3TT25_9BACT|nr:MULTISPECIES: hypothetical protein [unclassified Aquirufa]MDT8887810.1 hypothetical protein [Aquirufa sp. LEPPI-3A]MDU0808980.1 hypothetical protein [Aquirufa sp. LEOWEIH-7C]